MERTGRRETFTTLLATRDKLCNLSMIILECVYVCVVVCVVRVLWSYLIRAGSTAVRE